MARVEVLVMVKIIVTVAFLEFGGFRSERRGSQGKSESVRSLVEGRNVKFSEEGGGCRRKAEEFNHEWTRIFTNG
jgi:hypothetical protein